MGEILDEGNVGLEQNLNCIRNKLESVGRKLIKKNEGRKRKRQIEHWN
jgi:hypothetical protein